MIELELLERLAQESTPGAWQFDDTRAIGHAVIGNTAKIETVALCPAHRSEADARFIAAASPSTILAIVAELRALRAVAEAAKGWHAGTKAFCAALNLPFSRSEWERPLAESIDAISGKAGEQNKAGMMVDALLMARSQRDAAIAERDKLRALLVEACDIGEAAIGQIDTDRDDGLASNAFAASTRLATIRTEALK